MSDWRQWDDFEGETAQTEPVFARSEERPLTVSQLAERIRFLLEDEFPKVWVEGEVTGFKVAQSGHAYFSLKDEVALIDCVIWRRTLAHIGTLPADGDHVEVQGSVTTYQRGSRYQIVVNSIRPAGLGRLYQKFLALKERLEREGLFDHSRKQPLPPHPQTVGVVTSPKGAAIRDIIKVLGRRAPQVRIILYPTPVQGDEAPHRIAQAIRRMNELGMADVLIVGRGGGSLEDLWAFNEEVVARAIADSKIPVISAVGHETDFTIADFVADVRAPTPSAAAEIVARDSGELRRLLATAQRRMKSAMDTRLAPLRRVRDLRKRLVHSLRQRVQRLAEARLFRQRAIQSFRKRLEKFRRTELLQEKLVRRTRELLESRREICRRFELLVAREKPLQQVYDMTQRLDVLSERLRQAVQRELTERSRRLELLTGKLVALDPKAILSRGYSITFDATTQEILKSATKTHEGQLLRIVLYEGEVGARVVSRSKAAGPQPATASKCNEEELPLIFKDE